MSEELQQLQEIWDRTIIRAWRENWYCWKMIRSFMAEAKLLGLWQPETDDKSEVHKIGLKRLNKHVVYNQDARRWVADNLAPMNNMLWDGKDEEVIMSRLRRIDVVHYDKEKGMRHKELMRTRQMRRTKTAPERRSDQWGVTKPVRSK